MRNKSLYIFLFLFCLSVGVVAQTDAATPAYTQGTNILFGLTSSQRKQKMGSLFNKVGCDTVSLPSQAFEPGFGNEYIDDKEFDYQRDKDHYNFFAYWKKKIYEWIAWLLGYGSVKQMPGLISIMLMIVAGIIVLLVIYFVVRYMMNHSGKWFFQSKNEELELDIHDTAQLIQSADFGSLIKQMEQQGDTRQAIRLYYLWMLKDLKDRQLIDWQPDKTNADYLYELHEEGLRSKFSYLSYLFNYIWYGEFSINDTDYLSARKAFQSYLRKEASDE